MVDDGKLVSMYSTHPAWPQQWLHQRLQEKVLVWDEERRLLSALWATTVRDRKRSAAVPTTVSDLTEAVNQKVMTSCIDFFLEQCISALSVFV